MVVLIFFDYFCVERKCLAQLQNYRRGHPGRYYVTGPDDAAGSAAAPLPCCVIADNFRHPPPPLPEYYVGPAWFDVFWPPPMPCCVAASWFRYPPPPTFGAPTWDSPGDLVEVLLLFLGVAITQSVSGSEFSIIDELRLELV
ncbi:hypothetical protein QTP88_009428 [Uroleucon formosanum]